MSIYDGLSESNPRCTKCGHWFSEHDVEEGPCEVSGCRCGKETMPTKSDKLMSVEEATDRLDDLVRDPHPGLSTWVNAYGIAVNNIIAAVRREEMLRCLELIPRMIAAAIREGKS